MAQLTNIQTGEITEVSNSGGQVTASGASNLQLDIPQSQVLGTSRVGDSLVVDLVSGQQIVVQEFFAFEVAGQITAQAIGGAVAGGVGALGAGGLGIAGAGVAALAVGAGIAGGSTGSTLTAAEEALNLLNAFAANSDTNPVGTSPAPTVADYAAAGVTGVTAANLADVNAAVNAAVGTAADEVSELQALVDIEIAADTAAAALATVAAYAANGDTNPAGTNPAPTVADYAAAGVTGVTAANLADVNAAVNTAAGTAADEVSEVQSLVAAEVAADAGLAAIAAYAANSDATPAGTSPAPTVAQYAAAGVTGVTAANLADVNAAVNAAVGTAADEVSELQGLVAAEVAADALEVIEAYAQNSAAFPAPTVADYAAAGVTGVTAVNLADVNAAIDAVDGSAADEVSEVQAIVDIEVAADVAAALAVISAYASNSDTTPTGTNPAPTVADYAAVGVTGVTAANLTDVNAAVDAGAGTAADEVSEIQAIVNTEVAADVAEAQAVITAYASNSDTTPAGTNPAPTVAQYAAAGVTGVTGGNISDVNAAINNASSVQANTVSEVQAFVDAEVAADAGLAVIAAYAANSDTTPAGTNPAPTAAQYAAAGVTGVTAANLADVNAAVDASTGADANTTPEIQTLVDTEVAAATGLAAIAAYAANSDTAPAGTNPAPTVEQYAAAGITDVTAANLADVNAAVNAVAGTAADEVSEIQAIVAAEVATDTAQALAAIAAYAANSDTTPAGTSPAPTGEQYATAGITGVNASNLADVNAAVNAAVGTAADELPEIQAIVAAEVAEALAVIAAYAANSDTTPAGTNPAPTVEQYAAAGITDVTAANLADVNAAVNAAVGSAANETSEVQALVAAEVAADAGLAAIAAYASNSDATPVGTNPAPTVAQYAAAGITGVTLTNLADVNAAVNAAVGTDADETSEVQALVNTEVAADVTEALAVIAAYAANSDTTPAGTSPAPTVAQYAAAGITGVNVGNITDVNAAVNAATEVTANEAPEIQALVDTEVAADAGLAAIAAYASNSDSTPAGANPAPTVAQYSAAGITDVTLANIADVNAAVNDATGADANTIPEIQALVDTEVAADAGLSAIAAYASNSDSTPAGANPAPTVAQYSAAGITDVTADNLADVNAAVNAVAGSAADEISEIQALVDVEVTQAFAVITAYAANSDTTPVGTNPAPTVAQYSAAGITDVTADNLADVNAAVNAVAGSAADTRAEVQALVATEVAADAAAALAVIASYASNSDTTPAGTNPAPTVAQYAAAGVIDVTAANLTDVNAAVNGAIGTAADEVAEIQALVGAEVAEDAALAVIANYASNSDTTPAGTNPAPTVAQYAAAGITGVNAVNRADVNAAVNASTAADADEASEIQALVNTEVAADTAAALAIIAAYASNSDTTPAGTNPAPTIDDYAAAGITGVTSGNLADVNEAVNAVAGTAADEVAEVQALVNVEVAADAAEALASELGIITAYASNSDTNPAPTVATYANAGVTGVTLANLSDVNAALDAVAETGADTLPEVQALVNAEIAADMAGALKVIADYASNSDTTPVGTNPAPTAEQYATAGVTGVNAANLISVNSAVNAVAGAAADEVPEIQALVNAEVATALAVITAYASNSDTTPAGTNPVPTESQYAAAGITGVGPGNIAAVNSAVNATTGNMADSVAEVQALVPAPNVAFGPAIIVDNAAPIAYGVSSGDFNGDGIVDLASTALGNGREMNVYLGNGDGTFGSEILVDAGINFLVGPEIADFNGDGILDILGAKHTANTVPGEYRVYLGNGDGSFGAAITAGPAGYGLRDVETADFNGDGIIDLAGASEIDNTYGVYLGNGDGTFGTRIVVDDTAVDARYIEVGDFNGDGISDMATAAFDGDRFSVYLGNGDGSFGTEVVVDPLIDGPNHISAADINGDGILDLIAGTANDDGDVVNLGGGRLFEDSLGLYLGNGDGTFGDRIVVDETAESGSTSEIVDLNGDGFLDIVATLFDDDSINVYLGKGDGSFEDKIVVDAEVDGPLFSTIADFDNDGDLDFATSALYDGTLNVYLQEVI